MAVQRISTRTRAALWRAHDMRCVYCSSPITFAELEIDHVIPESLRNDPEELHALLSRLGTAHDFDLDSLDNLVPTHGDCNRRKAALVFSESSVRYYRELAQARVPRVSELQEPFAVQATNERLLTSLADRIERGLLSRREISRVLPEVPVEPSQPVSEPVVVGFSMNVYELQATGGVPTGAPSAYPQLCDWLEQELVSSLRAGGPAFVVPCEGSERNGETLSVRLASWAVDINRLSGLLPPYWQIVEVAPYSDVYGERPDALFLKALVQTANTLAQTANKAVRSADPDQPYRCCPRCGSEDLAWSHDSNYHLAEDVYYYVKCGECGWSHEEK